MSTLLGLFALVIAYNYYNSSKSTEMTSTWRPVVAVAGGTGKVGSYITTALLSPQFSSSFKEVRLLTANTSSEKARALAAKGAKTIGINYSDEKSILSAIHGADVLVNALGGSVNGFPAKNALMHAAIKDGGIKVYFPSEFGIGKTWDFTCLIQITDRMTLLMRNGIRRGIIKIISESRLLKSAPSIVDYSWNRGNLLDMSC